MGMTGWAHARVPHTTRGDLGEAFVPDPQMAQIFDLGFTALASDYHWLQAIQVAGGHQVVDAERAGHLGRLVDVVTTLNPYVGHPYRFAAVWLTHDDAQVREGIRLLQRATEHDPEDWRNHFYIGFNHFFYLGEYAEAAASLERTIDLPGRPAYLPRLVARLKSHTGDIDVAEVFLRELLRSTEDDETRAKIQAGLDEIELEHKARHLDRARSIFKELAGRDITAVDELIEGPNAVLRRLPSPEPDALPEVYARGSVWRIDPKTDRIVTTFVGKRYEVHFSGYDQKRLEERARAKARAAQDGDGSRGLAADHG